MDISSSGKYRLTELSTGTCWNYCYIPTTWRQTKCCFQTYQTPTTYPQWCHNLEQALHWVGVHFLAPSISRWHPSVSFMWDFMTDNFYVSLVPITLNNLNNQIWNATARSEHALLQNIWPEVQRSMKKDFLSCSLQWYTFNFYVTATFFQKLFVTAHIICNHPVWRSGGGGEVCIQARFEPICKSSQHELQFECVWSTVRI